MEATANLRTQINALTRAGRIKRGTEHPTHIVIFGLRSENVPSYVFCFEDQVETVVNAMSLHSDLEFAHTFVKGESTKIWSTKEGKVLPSSGLPDLSEEEAESFYTNLVLQIRSDEEPAEKTTSRLIDTYNEGSMATRELIDDIFITICGWSLQTLVNQAKASK